MHVDRERRRRRMVGEPALLANDFRERASETSKFPWQRETQVSSVAQLLEILGEECIVPIVPGPTAPQSA